MIVVGTIFLDKNKNGYMIITKSTFFPNTDCTMDSLSFAKYLAKILDSIKEYKEQKDED